MEVLSIAEEEVDIESMGYKEDLQRVHDKIDKLSKELRPVEARGSWNTPGVYVGLASLGVALIGLPIIFMTWLEPHLQNDLKNDISVEVTNQLKGPHQQIDTLSEQVNELKGEFEQFDKRALAKMRSTIEAAQQSGKEIPEAQLADFKSQVRQISTSVSDYWTTAAAIINYQSLLNQMRGQAPDPSKVSHPCVGVTSSGGIMSRDNVFDGVTFPNCVVDLDNETFIGVTFKDSVIRYHGGQTTLSNVQFINCRFVMDVKAHAKPRSPDLLFALLQSPTQKTVTLPSPATHS